MIVSLTQVGKKYISKKFFVSKDKIATIPTCVDFDVFKKFTKTITDQVRQDLCIKSSVKVLVYSGSLGGNYDINIPLKVYSVFKKVHVNTHLLFLTNSDSDLVLRACSKYKISKDEYTVLSVSFNQVYKYLIASDLGFVFYKKGQSNLGRSPTKLGEYWACGIPVLSLEGIGDVDQLLNRYSKNGTTIKLPLNDESIKRAIRKLNLNVNKKDLRSDAQSVFSLDHGVRVYSDLYNKIGAWK